MSHKACSPDCAAELIRRENLRREQKAASSIRNEIRAKREAMKSRAKWLAEAQAAFNKFIRLRDANQPCISCGRFHTGAYDAGHYRSVGAVPALRFHEDNCHRQCVPCNQYKSGNVVEYRIRLIQRIGSARVEWLEGPHESRKYSIEEAKATRDEYRKKAKLIEVRP